MSKIIINKTTYIIELVGLFIVGCLIGWYSNNTYTMIHDYINGEPLGYLCKKGITYIQADPTSTVYIKSDSNLECANESGKD